MRRAFALLVLILQSLATALALPPGDQQTDPKAVTAPAAEEGLFGQIPVVEAATLHSQTLAEAPASVTVITAAEIRLFGYRTLAEALSGVRGFYFTNDGQYDYGGIRGMAIPGDYNSEFLVMLNGHPLTENIYNSNNFFEQDFGLDMDLVEKIEIVRGPCSALYGSNGMLANINIVTKSPVDWPKFRASVEAGNPGEKKALVSSSLDLGKGANLLLSASVFDNGGRDLFVQGYGMAQRVNAEKGYHAFANLVWGRWGLTGYFNSRVVYAPVAGGGTIFDDQGTRLRDSRNFIGLNYSREIGQDGLLRWQVNYDQYRYNDRYDYPLDDGQVEDNRTGNWGDWLDSQLTYSFEASHYGMTTVGIQGSVDLRNLQVNGDVAPARQNLLRVSNPDRSGAVFAQQEARVSANWTAYLGLRADFSQNFASFASPQLALVYHPAEGTSYKLVYGRPFRNPSSFERYYDDGLYQAANPHLSTESADAVEGSVEHRFRHNLTGLVNAFDDRLRGVIEGVWTADGLLQYQNAGNRRSDGVEFEARTNPESWLQADASFVVQRASDGTSGQRLPNSPGQIVKGRLAGPLARNRLYLSGGLQYLSARSTVTGGAVRPVALIDLTLTTKHLTRGFDLAAGIRNLLNWQYDEPVYLSIDRMRAEGRTFFIKVIWEQGDATAR